MSDDEDNDMFTSVIEPKPTQEEAGPVKFTLGEEEEETVVDAVVVESVADDESSTTTEQVAEVEPLTLYEEAANNQMDAVCGLVGRADVDIDAVDSCGDTALLLAVRNNHAHIVALLLQHGADTQLGNNTTPLHEAVTHNHAHLVQMLLLGGADSNALDGAGLTPLYYTVQHNHVELARALLLAGAKPTCGTHTSALDAARDSPHTYLHQIMESAVEKQEAETRMESPRCIMIAA